MPRFIGITVSRLIPIRWGNSIDVEKNISSVVPTQGALVRANFDTRIGVRALITVTRGGKPVPFGSLVRENSTGITSMVGDDGQVYLSGAPLSGELLVQWGDGANSRCIAHYVLPKQSLQQAVTVISAVCTHPWLIKEIINEDNLQIIIGDGMFVSGKHILGLLFVQIVLA